MKLLCLDTENTFLRYEDKDFVSEIVQIGVCTINTDNLTIYDCKCYNIKPSYSTIHDDFTKLTGITKEELSKGISYQKAIKHLVREYGSRSRTLLTWGDDRIMFKKHSDGSIPRVQSIYPFSDHHINLFNLYDFCLGNNVHTNLENALKVFKLEFVGRPHNALCDSINTARLFCAIIKRFRASFCNVDDTTFTYEFSQKINTQVLDPINREDNLI